MIPVDCDGGERIRRLAGSALGSCRVLLEELAQKTSDLERIRRDAKLRIKALKLSRKEIAQRIAFVERLIPLEAASSLINRKSASRSRDLERSLTEARDALAAATRTVRKIESNAVLLRTSAAELARVRDHAFPNFDSLEIDDALDALERRTDLLSRSRPTAARHADLCRDLVRTAGKAASARRIPTRAPQPPRVEVPSGRPESSPDALKDLKIHLPIPKTLWGIAGRKGALRDDDAPKGVSPFYLTPRMDMRPFADLLPSALKGPQGFSFPPIHPNAPGQNLWTMFDTDTWSHIRNTSYGLTGHRCSICGGRGGYLADKLYPDGSRSGVDCHEIWEWKAPDLKEGVGIQTLKNLLVVCVSCHAAFHENFFVRMADGIGEADKVRAHIQKRRHLMTRLDQATLGLQLERERGDLERLNGVTDWIVDLDHLGRQQFMRDRIPVFVERNPSGISSSRIAGLDFQTDRGEIHVRRSADKVYGDVVRESRKPEALRERSLPSTSAGAYRR